jgi:hypothetical protein
MRHILLTGAGFTRNWGGWLATEIEGDLLRRVRDDGTLLNLVQNSDGFETALEVLQREVAEGKTDARAQYERLKTAVLESFREINLALAKRVQFNFSNDRAFSVNRFLARFDAIYTLNQDLLLELHYDPSLEDSRQPRWNARYFPGIAGYVNRSSFKVDLVDEKRRVIGPPLQHDRFCQPIYKLHGSVDWIDESGDFLIIGGGKESMINDKPILVEYLKEFKQRLRERDVRLMIIGYGFRDQHINRLLGEAWDDNHSLSAFYVDPLGRKVIRGGGENRVLPQYTPPWGWLTCIGESVRLLSSTFNGDELELAKLERFFA